HDVAETCEISDYIYLLGDGTVMGHGTPEQLLASQEPLVQQFMNALPDGPVPFHYPARPYIEDLLEAV
ncbi:MAG: phospholipid ABC transporter ATP-binding protein MlaF, partial [Gammaproteobacteria bacterium]